MSDDTPTPTSPDVPKLPVDEAASPTTSAAAAAASDTTDTVDPAVPTPRTAQRNAAQLKELQKKVALLEAQLEKASPGSVHRTSHLTDDADGADSPGVRFGMSESFPLNSSAAAASPGTSPLAPSASTSGPVSPSSAGPSSATAATDPPLSPGGSDGGAGGGSGSGSGAGAGAGAGTGDDDRAVSPTAPLRRGFGSALDFKRPQTSDARRLTADELLISKVKANMAQLVAGRTPLVLVSTGAYNPIHLQHVRLQYLARRHLTAHTEYQVVGGVISPSHDNYVKGQLRRFPSQVIPARHRVAMAELAVEGSSWLCAGRWEATRRRVSDYRSVLKHMKQLLEEAFPHGKAPRVMYLCGADHLILCGPQVFKDFGCICCSRPGYTEELERAIGKKYRRLVHIVDDDTVLTTTLDSLSSTKVRKRMLAKQSVHDMVGDSVGAYLVEHKIADKIAGRTPWTDADKAQLSYNVGGRAGRPSV